MDIAYQLQGIAFQWDGMRTKLKATGRHGIAFEEAAEVFFDPFHQIGNASTDDEQWDFILGYSLSQRILLVVYVERDERTRIISARRVTRCERKLYEEA